MINGDSNVGLISTGLASQVKKDELMPTMVLVVVGGE